MSQYKFFLLTRINPSEADVKVFLDGCKDMEACFYGYDIVRWKAAHSLKGFVVVDGNRDTERIERLFPNFLVKAVRITDYNSFI